MQDQEALNRQFAIPEEVGFRVEGHGALVAQITNARSAGQLACQGAQLLAWAPVGQAPVVWLSPAARFAEGKSLRGGAPICWPWFGPHPDDPAKPAHGFARNLDWAVDTVTSLGDATRLVLRFVPGQAQKALWPYDAELTLTVTMGETLRLDLATRNLGEQTFDLTQAVHTYFHVGDIGAVRVEGLDGCEYVDRAHGDAALRQAGPVLIGEEVNRIYLGCPGDVLILDESLQRRIRVSKQGSTSYVVWNPWEETAARFGDMGEDGYRRMLCVETTNAWTDSVRVDPGGDVTLSTEYAVEPL
jgi:glucose-6-phosphate 1-epimerase